MVPLPDVDHRGYTALRDYLTGETSLTLLQSGLRGVPRETVQRLLRDFRQEFEAINPVRAVLLESVAVAKR